jgi:acetyltransferase-like isoleucine patch superfamily enzyme
VLGPGVVLIAEGEGVIDIGEGTVLANNVFMRTRNKIALGQKNEVLAFTSIEPREALSNGEFRTEKGVTINVHNFIDTTANVSLGSETHTGPYCMFYTHNHNFERAGSIWDQGIRIKQIKVGSGIWMGSRVMVMPGAVIGDGCVVAACSVVTREFDADELVLGVPAKTVRKRVTQSG